VAGLFLAIEFCLAFIAITAAYAVPNLAAWWYQRAGRLLKPLARRPRLAVLVVGLLALAARAAVLPILPVPQPAIHDEFSYLLAADTFAHGRLTNPTHPMWIHFESFHIIQKPTYASMYYPGQGLLLAAGQVFFGHPFVAVWLSVGVMCAAICWMLQGWLPASWALLGGFLATMRLAVFSYWANSYYGGALAAIGGALVLGALPRIKRRQRVGDALLMGFGLAILANTRPYEGLFFGIPIAVALFLWMFKKKGPLLRISIRHILLPIGLLLALTIAAMGYYFWRVTGSPFRTGYQVDMQTYGLLYFPWQKLQPPPQFHHAVMRNFYLGKYNIEVYEYARSHPFPLVFIKLLELWLFFLGPVLTLPLLAWVAVKPFGRFRNYISRKTRFLMLLCFISAVGIALPIYVPQPHYAAALTGAIYALVLQAMRHVRLWKWNQEPTGLAVPLICLGLLLLRAVVPVAGIAVPPGLPRTWYSPQWGNADRSRALSQLTGIQGRQLAIVRYKPDHDIADEWVYNEADIDNSKVVWAREMSPAENEKLITYFKDRQVWLAEPDENPPRLSPYPVAANR
jgi:hypothetical protein